MTLDFVGGRTFFLYVGTDKAGSTWLESVLSRHPECFVPHIKDVYYFDQNYHRGPGWYAAFFGRAEPRHRAMGELSHDYLYDEEAARRIKRDVPGARILIGIREPVSRAFSAYLFLRRHGLTRVGFEEALTAFPELVDRGRYTPVIQRYLDLFPREQVHVVVFDDIRRRPEETARDLYRFLDLDQQEEYVVPEKTLPAAEPRAAGVALLAKRAAVALRGLGMTRALGSLKRNALIQRLLYRPYDEYPAMEPETRRALGKAFEDDVTALEELLDLDLSRWRKSWGD